ncbi:MAG: hypothetical protein H8D46_02125, partial [FCB group bacterium]|nr:hypothetical protein [FCB group bacterium]
MLKWIAAAILLLGLSFGQSSTYSSFDAGIRFGLNMPGPEQFLNTSAVGLHAGYWLSPSYRISMNYSSSRLSADEDEYPDLENDHLSLLYFEFSRHQCLGEDFTAYSLIGMGNMMKDDEDQMGFVFGFGIQYPLSRQILLD